MKSVITGGAGFIGSHLAEAVVKLGHRVVVIDNFCTGRMKNLENIRDRIEIIEDNIDTFGDWRNNFVDADWVFHLAALADIVPSIERPEDYFEVNVNGTFNVLRASKEAQVSRFIYTASSSCYGIPDEFPTLESSQIQPQYPYALTKWLGEELVLHWSKVFQLPAISLRLFNVYGPRSRTAGTYGAVFGVFLAQLLANQAFTVVGDGNQTRDFTYVSDIVDAFIAGAKSHVTSEVFNVGSGATVSVNRIVELLGGKEKVHLPKRPGEPDCTFADIAKIRRCLGWEPRIRIEEGVEQLLHKVDDWKDAPVWTPETIEQATRGWFHHLGVSKED
jgi:UDP-glucose 4-epimerase